MYLQLRLSGATFGSNGRAFVRALLDGPEFDQRFRQLFHLDPDGAGLPGNHTGEGLAPIRIGTTDDRTLLISAVGSAAAEYLAENAGVLTARIASRCAGEVVSEMRAGVCKIEPAPYLKAYAISSLVWQRGQGVYHSFRASLVARQFDAAGLSEHVAGVITSGLERQCDLLCLDVPEDLLIGDVTIENGQPLLVREKTYMHAARVTFKANVSLSGPWSVGYLCARGRGNIRALRSARRSRYADADHAYA